MSSLNIYEMMNVLTRAEKYINKGCTQREMEINITNKLNKYNTETLILTLTIVKIFNHICINEYIFKNDKIKTSINKAKDNIRINDSNDNVYQILCKDCNKTYNVHNGTNLKTRI